jgi:hypothetical protein
MEMVLIKIGSPEWQYMWNWLKEHPLNSGLEDGYLAMHPDSKEAWQYMGSYKNKDRVIHDFRHRQHPVTQKLEKLSVMASNELVPDQIEKVIKIK